MTLTLISANENISAHWKATLYLLHYQAILPSERAGIYWMLHLLPLSIIKCASSAPHPSATGKKKSVSFKYTWRLRQTTGPQRVSSLCVPFNSSHFFILHSCCSKPLPVCPYLFTWAADDLSLSPVQNLKASRQKTPLLADLMDFCFFTVICLNLTHFLSSLSEEQKFFLWSKVISASCHFYLEPVNASPWDAVDLVAKWQ